jgi:GMP synthase-like glutamine amidotransferase|tara:strand:+ start:59 stop:787 length:729 start_codon:yes stop_codon:yes gene_type:complete
MSILIIEHSDLTGSDRLGEQLLEDGNRLQIVRVHHGEQLPKDLNEIDGVISCGGPQPPNCNEPWTKQELKLIREADNLGIPLLGLCLGSQLIARALGGECAQAAEPELGWHDVSLTPVGRQDVIFSGQPWCGPQFHWHNWEVTKLPEGAVVLASSDKCKNQAWVKGVNTYAIQFHPECTPEIIDTWIDDGAAEMASAGINGNAIREETETQFDNYERLTNRLFDAISQLLMPMHKRLSRQRH